MSKNDILKKAEEYMKLKYRFELTEDEAEGGYVISYPDLIGCMSSGETIEEAVKNGEDARRENAQIPAQAPCGAFQAGRNQYESVLYLSTFALQLNSIVNLKTTQSSMKNSIMLGCVLLYVQIY